MMYIMQLMYVIGCEINKLTKFIIIEWHGVVVKGLVFFMEVKGSSPYTCTSLGVNLK